MAELSDRRWDPATVVRQLREQPGGDIIVLNSGSVIRTLLDAGELDRLHHPLPRAGRWRRLPLHRRRARLLVVLTDLSTSESGAICLIYDRIRNES